MKHHETPVIRRETPAGRRMWRVTLTVTPPAIFRQDRYTLTYEVEAWDADDAENRAIAYAVRARGIWREWAAVQVERMAVRA
jgi:hypothetical protein